MSSRLLSHSRLHTFSRPPLLKQSTRTHGTGQRFSPPRRTHSIPHRPHNDAQSRQQAGPGNIPANALFTRACLTVGAGVFGAWNFADGGLLYKMYDKFAREQGPTLHAWTGLALPPAPRTGRLRAALHRYFTVNAGEPGHVAAWVGAAFSHRDSVHALFNYLTWWSFARLLYPLPPVHMAALVFGSAVTGAGAWLYQQRDLPLRKSREALGASGIVSGLLAACTMFVPFARATVLFVVPAPLFVVTGAYLAVDTYLMRSGADTGIGHAAHLGGGAFGVLYYFVFLRRFRGFVG